MHESSTDVYEYLIDDRSHGDKVLAAVAKKYSTSFIQRMAGWQLVELVAQIILETDTEHAKETAEETVDIMTVPGVYGTIEILNRVLREAVAAKAMTKKEANAVIKEWGDRLETVNEAIASGAATLDSSAKIILEELNPYIDALRAKVIAAARGPAPTLAAPPAQPEDRSLRIRRNARVVG